MTAPPVTLSVRFTPVPKVIAVEPTLSWVLAVLPEFRLKVRFAFLMADIPEPTRVRACVVLVSLADVMPTSTLAFAPVVAPMVKPVPELEPVPAKVAPAPTVNEPVPVAEPRVLAKTSVPPLTVVPPLYVLAPENVCEFEPTLVTLALPVVLLRMPE